MSDLARRALLELKGCNVSAATIQRRLCVSYETARDVMQELVALAVSSTNRGGEA